jgi:hypothetical protein
LLQQQKIEIKLNYKFNAILVVSGADVVVGSAMADGYKLSNFLKQKIYLILTRCCREGF